MGRRFATALALAMLGLSAACTDDGTTPNTPAPDDVEEVTLSLPKPTTLAGVPSIPLERLETARLDLDSPDWLASLDGSLWVRLDNGSVLRVDPARAKVIAEIAPEGESQFSACQILGAGGEALWACGDSFVQRIDPGTNTIAKTFDLALSKSAGNVAAVDGEVWLLGSGGQSLVPIDESSNEVGEPIDLGASCSDLAAVDSAIWVTCPFDDVALVVDVESRAITTQVAIDEPSSVNAGRHVWVTSPAGVIEVEPRDFSVKAVVDVGEVETVDVYESEESAWVRFGNVRGGPPTGVPFLVGIDPSSGQPFTAVTSSDLRSGGNCLLIDGQLWASAFDDAALVRLRAPTP
jgi:hypothetical protein